MITQKCWIQDNYRQNELRRLEFLKQAGSSALSKTGVIFKMNNVKRNCGAHAGHTPWEDVSLGVNENCASRYARKRALRAIIDSTLAFTRMASTKPFCT